MTSLFCCQQRLTALRFYCTHKWVTVGFSNLEKCTLAVFGTKCRDLKAREGALEQRLQQLEGRQEAIVAKERRLEEVEAKEKSVAALAAQVEAKLATVEDRQRQVAEAEQQVEAAR